MPAARIASSTAEWNWGLSSVKGKRMPLGYLPARVKAHLRRPMIIMLPRTTTTMVNLRERAHFGAFA